LMSHSIAWLQYAWRRHGPLGLIRVAAYNLLLSCTTNLIRKSQATDRFDQEYGTDTSGIREIRTLDVLNFPSARYAVRYGPSNARSIRAVLDGLELDYAQFSFIDYGSGKGRVLIVAAGFPFKEVIGVEFSRELHETALKNIARISIRRSVIRCAEVASLHCDAASFQPPKSNLVCYFYNPFGPPVMAAVTARLISQYEQSGCEIIIIYVDPRHRDIFERTGKFSVLNETDDFVVLHAPPQALTSLSEPGCQHPSAKQAG